MADQLESASDYLDRHNFRSLVEWLTAEVILNRPKDPLCFVRDLVCDKIESRTGSYDAEEVTSYAKRTYAQAAATADVNGEIRPHKSPKMPPTLSDKITLLNRLESFEAMVVACNIIAQKLDLVEATDAVVDQLCTVLNCERATIFMVNEEEQQLELVVANVEEKITFPMTSGIAGQAALGNVLVNIPNAYEDERFNPEMDKQTGFKTVSILASPIRSTEGKVIGVIQAINKKKYKEPTKGSGRDLAALYQEEEKDGVAIDGNESYIPFTRTDEEILSLMASQAAIALTNAELYQKEAASRCKVRSLLDIIQAMHSDLGINSLLFTITERAHQLVEAERCTMFLLDDATKELWSLQGDVNLRIPMNKGIAGECCTTNKMINIADAYEDERFNKEVDKQSGYRTRAILCMPCNGNDGKVVGVIQLINKEGGGMFTGEDVELMQSFLLIAGPLLAESSITRRKSTMRDEFPGNVQMAEIKQSSSNLAATIQEEDEEEEEEEEAQ